MTVDDFDIAEPEYEADIIVSTFETGASKLERALSDPAMRNLILANRDRILRACEAAFRIEARLLFGNEPALAAE
jgi:hypothetical protein